MTAPDGDPGYGPLRMTVSQKWLSLREDSFEDLVQVSPRMKKVTLPLADGGPLSKIRAIPIADPLHALKMASSSVLENTVTCNVRSSDIIIQRDKLRNRWPLIWTDVLHKKEPIQKKFTRSKSARLTSTLTLKLTQHNKPSSMLHVPRLERFRWSD